MKDTKTRIFDAAERLLAEKGFYGVSLRAILAEAGVNPALGHYHFGSRENLVRNVLYRRIVPLNEERLRRLAAVTEAASEGGPRLEDVLRAFMAPVVEFLDAFPHGGRLLGHLHASPDPGLRAFYNGLFVDLFKAFSRAFRACLPAHVEGARRLARGHFFLGALVHTLTNHAELMGMAGEKYAVPRGEALVEEIVAFCAAGLRAPAPG